MTTATFKSFLRRLLLIGVLAVLLLSLAACKKKPVATEPSTQPSASTQTTTVPETTEETSPATTTKPTETTAPAETTDPTETTSDCEHILSTWKVEKTSTCTTEGSRYKECILCEVKVEVETIPKTAHIPGSWIVDKMATCSVEGRQHQDCTQCKATLIYITIAKDDHITTVIPGYAATTEKPGLTDGKKCTVCKEIIEEQQVIPAVGSEEFAYTINSDKKTCIISGLGTYSGNQVIIPASISGYKVTSIGESAFAGNKNITSIQLPNTINQIGKSAFSGCSSLTTISFKGTKEEWHTITKGTGWNSDTGNYSIACSDGTISGS